MWWKDVREAFGLWKDWNFFFFYGKDWTIMTSRKEIFFFFEKDLGKKLVLNCSQLRYIVVYFKFNYFIYI